MTASRRRQGAAALKSREGPADTFYCQSGTLFFASVKIFLRVDDRSVDTEMSVLETAHIRKAKQNFFVFKNKYMQAVLKRKGNTGNA